MPLDDAATLRDQVLAWFDAYKDSLYRYLRTLLYNPADIDDVIQTTFLALLEKGTAACHIRHPKTYIYRIARYKAIDLLRHYSHAAVSLEGLLVEPAHEVMPQRILAEHVNWALAQLTPLARETVVLKVCDKLTFREVAQVTGCLLPTAATRYMRAIHKLRALLEECHENK